MKKPVLMMAGLLLLSYLTGCTVNDSAQASVQSVSMICRQGSVGTAERFAGGVTTQGETKITRDEGQQIESIQVKVGDLVQVGQVLFTYDQSLIELRLEKAELELEQMKNALSNKEKEKEQLEKDKEHASSDQKGL